MNIVVINKNQEDKINLIEDKIHEFNHVFCFDRYKPDTTVPAVYNTEGTVMGYSDGYLVPLTTTSTSEKTRLICDTPAELVLDKGAITLLAGNSTDISDEFTINATGGTQHWNIRAENPVLYWTGVALAIVGTCFCTYGVMDWAVETQEATVFNTISTFGGAAGLAGGIVMGILGSPKATLVKIEY